VRRDHRRHHAGALSEVDGLRVTPRSLSSGGASRRPVGAARMTQGYLLRRQRHRDLRVDRRKRLGEALAFRIEQRCSARGGDCIDAGANRTRLRAPRDHARLDRLVVRKAALPGVAIALMRRRIRRLRAPGRRELRAARFVRAMLRSRPAPRRSASLSAEALELGETPEAQISETLVVFTSMPK